MNTLAFSYFTAARALLAILVIALVSPTQAQHTRSANRYFKGFDASFGQLAFKSESNIGEINRNQVNLAGGQIGLILGTPMVRTKVGILGYYSSVSDIAGTIDLYQNNISANVYPLALLTEEKLIFNPYITAGMNYNRFKMYGYYLSKDAGPVNYSVTLEKSLGTLRQFNATLGAGFEINILEDNNFVHLYSEAIYAKNLSGNFDHYEFRHTEFRNQLMVSVGVRYGIAP